MQIIGLLPFAIVVSIAVAACSSESPRFGGAVDDGRPADAAYEQHLEEQYADQAEQQAAREAEMEPPSYDSVPGLDDSGVPSSQAGAWSCRYSPTMNDNWHDDVVCSNGAESHRPLLRTWDGFVEEWEIMESASEYEAELNTGE